MKQIVSALCLLAATGCTATGASAQRTAISDPALIARARAILLATSQVDCRVRKMTFEREQPASVTFWRFDRESVPAHIQSRIYIVWCEGRRNSFLLDLPESDSVAPVTVETGVRVYGKKRPR